MENTIDVIKKCVEYFTKIDKDGRKQHTISIYKNLTLQYNGLTEGREKEDNRKITIIYNDQIVYPSGYAFNNKEVTDNDIIIIKRLTRLLQDINLRVLGIDYKEKMLDSKYSQKSVKDYLAYQYRNLRINHKDIYAQEKFSAIADSLANDLSKKVK